MWGSRKLEKKGRCMGGLQNLLWVLCPLPPDPGGLGGSLCSSPIHAVPQLTHINIVGKIWKRNRKLIGRGAAVCAPFPHFGALGEGGRYLWHRHHRGALGR